MHHAFYLFSVYFRDRQEYTTTQPDCCAHTKFKLRLFLLCTHKKPYEIQALPFVLNSPEHQCDRMVFKHTIHIDQSALSSTICLMRYSMASMIAAT